MRSYMSEETERLFNNIRYLLETLAIGIVGWLLITSIDLKDRMSVLETKQEQIIELKTDIRELQLETKKAQNILIELKADIKHIKEDL